MLHGHKKYHDEAERRQWQEPEPILKTIGMAPGMTFADIGCGDGFFTIPAARMAGRDGRVYALDADVGSIRKLGDKAEKEGLFNVSLIAADAESVVPCEGCADIVFFGICLHDFHDPEQVLMNARRMVKDGGKLADLDWKKKPTSRGPPVDIRFDETKASALITSAGFAVESISDAGPDHYLIIARPS
jgi:ubiquinone/menaquinone biosynthesis C-methylase UbiE